MSTSETIDPVVSSIVVEFFPKFGGKEKRKNEEEEEGSWLRVTYPIKLQGKVYKLAVRLRDVISRIRIIVSSALRAMVYFYLETSP